MKKAAVMLAPGYEEGESLFVVDIIRRGGFACDAIGLESLQVTGCNGITAVADKVFDGSLEGYDLVVLPGGMPGAANLAANDALIEAVRKMADEGKELGTERDWLVFFFVVGAVTSYVDFLNTPIVALGLPLATYLAIRHESVAKATLSEAAMLVAGACIAWGLGYGLLWASKWVLSAIVLGTNAFGDALGTASYRVGANGLGARIDAIRANVNTMFDTWQRYLVAALAVVLLVVGIVRHRRPCLPLAISLLVVTLLPILWYVALANHSTIHAFFVYRALSVSVYAGALMPALLIRGK